MNGRLSKIRSLHTYAMRRMFYFERYCKLKPLWPWPFYTTLFLIILEWQQFSSIDEKNQFSNMDWFQLLSNFSPQKNMAVFGMPPSYSKYSDSGVYSFQRNKRGEKYFASQIPNLVRKMKGWDYFSCIKIVRTMSDTGVCCCELQKPPSKNTIFGFSKAVIG